MKTMLMLAVAIFLTLTGAGFYAAGTYNVLVDKDETVNAAWAQVQNVYQRRLDLIPNLVETVKGAARFEKETLTAVTRARAAATGITMDAAAAVDPAKLEKFEKAQGAFGAALGRLLVAAEKYPDLKSNENFSRLQEELAETEERIAVERHNFNAVASVYNAALRKMPATLVARNAGFYPRPYFKAEEAAEKAPKVAF